MYFLKIISKDFIIKNFENIILPIVFFIYNFMTQILTNPTIAPILIIAVLCIT